MVTTIRPFLLLFIIIAIGAPLAGQAQTNAYAYLDHTTTYTNSADQPRSVTFRLWYPRLQPGVYPLILHSHGGAGSSNGHQHSLFLVEEYMQHGFVAVVLNHSPSSDRQQHLLDRPADVSAVLDALTNLPLPADFSGQIAVANAGHIGHSYGAYTSHAMAGAVFDQGVFRDSRIRAIVARSPQGYDQFGSFDEQSDLYQPSLANSWQSVFIPAYTMIGELERHGSVNQPFITANWRFFPFVRYPDSDNKIASLLPDADHADLGSRGSPAIQTFMAVNSRLFFEVYLLGRNGRRCWIGKAAALPGVMNFRKPSDSCTP
ncbi:MAG: hypothetical protein Tsb002_35280 [Wenzhouxiangellaceae bacterium]